MSFTSIPNSDVDANSPITVALMTAMRDNQNWNSPKVQAVTAAGTLADDDNNMLTLLDGTSVAFTYNLPASPADGMLAQFYMTNASNNVTLSGNGNNIDGSATIVFSVVDSYLAIAFDGTEWKSAKPSVGSVTQSEIAAAAVGQGELKTSSGSVSTTSTSLTDLTLPGGSYGFYPRVRNTAGATPTTTAQIAVAITSSSYVANIALQTSSGTFSAQADQIYVTASPPYDLGDGEIDGSFIFLLVDGLGDVVSTYQAPDPPWAHNGPTDIRPSRVDLATGKTFKRVSGLTASAVATDDALLAGLLDGSLDAAMTEIEITQAVKNADMPLIPHPFTGNDLTGRTVVMLDPMHRAVRTLHDMQQAGESVSGLFHSGRIKIGNTPLTRAAPPGVMPVSFHL